MGRDAHRQRSKDYLSQFPQTLALRIVALLCPLFEIGLMLSAGLFENL